MPPRGNCARSPATLADGASLVFTAAGNKVNVPILQDYIYHRLYSFDLHAPAKLVRSEPESFDVFVPRCALHHTAAVAAAAVASLGPRACRSGHDSEVLLGSSMPTLPGDLGSLPYADVIREVETKKKKAAVRRHPRAGPHGQTHHGAG